MEHQPWLQQRSFGVCFGNYFLVVVICLETDLACVSQLADQEVQPTHAHVTLINAIHGCLVRI